MAWPEKNPMNVRIHLTDEEFKAIDAMCKKQDVSLDVFCRQALRFYHDHLARLDRGETVHYSGDLGPGGCMGD